MGLSERTVSLKLNDKVTWKDDEILKAVHVLELNPQDIPKYFFNAKVIKHELKLELERIQK